jgi:hypothetical protein
MAKQPASVRSRVRRPSQDRGEDEAIDSFDVPAAVLCAFCGQADCAGCLPGDEDSGVVAIVPWERPGAGTWTRLWATANASTQGAETFFAALPDGALPPAVRFAILAEILAVSSMIALLVPFVALALPTLAMEVVANPAMRYAALRWLAVGVPVLAAWMVAAHATHGAALDVGASRNGGRTQQRRALRFGLYACGWDLMAGPLGAAVILFSKGWRAMLDLFNLSLHVPAKSSAALLHGVYGLRGEAAARARRAGSLAAFFIAAATGLVVVALITLFA